MGIQKSWKTKSNNIGSLTDEEKALRDDRRVTQTLRHTVVNSGVKGLAVLNSAGVAAMLGFFQALVSKPEVLIEFKPYGVGALSLFLIGAIAAALLFIPYGTYIQERGKKVRPAILIACFVLGAFAVGCAALGAMLVAVGVDRAF
jgi:hypothetical protein